MAIADGTQSGSSSVEPTAKEEDRSTETDATAPASVPVSSNLQCASCNQISTTPLKPCNKCHSVHYCSRDCQKADTKKHKKVCAAAAQIYAQTADFKPQTVQAPPKEGYRKGLRKWQFDT